MRLTTPARIDRALYAIRIDRLLCARSGEDYSMQLALRTLDLYEVPFTSSERNGERILSITGTSVECRFDGKGKWIGTAVPGVTVDIPDERVAEAWR